MRTHAGSGGDFAFAPGDGVLVIRGKVGPDGALEGNLNTQPAGKPAYVLGVTGRLSMHTATLTYVTPRCQYQATLTEVPVSALPW